MRRFVPLLLPALAATACTGDDVAAPTATTTRSPPTTAAPTTTLFDPTDDRPVLTIGSYAWSIPVIWAPRDSHDLAIYGDGRVVRIEHAFSESGTFPLRAMMSTWTVDPGQVASALRDADAAGLDVPGVHPPEPLPAGQEVVDGGYRVVARRTSSGVGVAALDQPGWAQPGTESERRELLDAIGAGLDGDRARSQPVRRWAIESATSLAAIAPSRWPWPAVDPDALTWTRSDAGLWCAIADDDDWPYTQDEAQDYEAIQHGIYRRPLLPHETTCDDVFAWRAELGMATGIRLFPEGLPPDNLDR